MSDKRVIEELLDPARKAPPVVRPVRWWTCLFGHRWTAWANAGKWSGKLADYQWARDRGLQLSNNVYQRHCTRCQVRQQKVVKP